MAQLLDIECKMSPLLKHDSPMEQLASEILEYWNSKRIVVHRKYSRKTPLILKRITEDYSKEEIFKAIDNYVTVINDESYKFDYKWNLEIFLQKSNALPDFMDGGSKWINYLGSFNTAKSKKKPIPIVEIGEDPFLPDNDNSKFIIYNYSKMIKAFRFMPYEEYLQTEHWLHFKAEALKASGYKCRVCNGNDVLLNVHHNNYDNRGRETFNDVIVLCEGCHGKFHNK